jgi:hypothetical protein
MVQIPDFETTGALFCFLPESRIPSPHTSLVAGEVSGALLVLRVAEKGVKQSPVSIGSGGYTTGGFGKGKTPNQDQLIVAPELGAIAIDTSNHHRHHHPHHHHHRFQRAMSVLDCSVCVMAMGRWATRSTSHHKPA